VSNEELVANIKAGIDTADNMLQLWKQTKAFVASIAKKYKPYAEWDDLMQEGYLALNAAAEGYDPQRSGSFLTYAGLCITGRMTRYISGNKEAHVPEYLQSKVREYDKAVNNFELKNGRKPTYSEIARYMGIRLESLDKILSTKAKLHMISLDAPIVNGNVEDTATFGEITASDENVEDTVLDQVEHEQLKSVLWSMVDELEAEQAAVVHTRYQNNLTKPQVGEILGISEKMVANIESKALRKLRCPKNIKKLRPFLAEQIEAMAYRSSASSFQRTWTSSTERAVLELFELSEIEKRAMEVLGRMV